MSQWLDYLATIRKRLLEIDPTVIRDPTVTALIGEAQLGNLSCEEFAARAIAELAKKIHESDAAFLQHLQSCPR